MSTDIKPLQGRHRAAVDARPHLRSASVPAFLGGLAAVLLALLALLVWQVA